jgi:hypothetical protein
LWRGGGLPGERGEQGREGGERREGGVAACEQMLLHAVTTPERPARLAASCSRASWSSPDRAQPRGHITPPQKNSFR